MLVLLSPPFILLCFCKFHVKTVYIYNIYVSVYIHTHKCTSSSYKHSFYGGVLVGYKAVLYVKIMVISRLILFPHERLWDFSASLDKIHFLKYQIFCFLLVFQCLRGSRKGTDINCLLGLRVEEIGQNLQQIVMILGIGKILKESKALEEGTWKCY